MSLAEDMFDECLAQGQSARTVPDAQDRVRLRSGLRRRARAAGVRVRTADRDGVVLVARVDARVWQDDAATMRAKLTPPRRGGPTAPVTRGARRSWAYPADPHPRWVICGQRAAQLLRRPVHRCVSLLVVQTGAVVAARGQLAVPEPALQLISREADSDDRDVTLGGRSPGGVAVVATARRRAARVLVRSCRRRRPRRSSA